MTDKQPTAMTQEPMLEGCRKAMLAELHRQGIRVIHDIACVDPYARHVEGLISTSSRVSQWKQLIALIPKRIG